ncbi:hypothetical protein [Streptomyces laurentii]|uniref:hypothetical protein n=1 Tax=Streptomyces laurentii TaxID=39478 RepID=UPI0036A33E24
MSSRIPRWFGRRTPASPAATTPGPGETPAGPHTVLEADGERFLLRSSADRASTVAELVRDLPAEPGRPVVVVDVTADAAGNLGEELGGLLGRLSADPACSAARLVMSGAAAATAERLPLAQRLADAWKLEIEAPDAPIVLVPGGGLYVAEPTTRAGGWWRFAPGGEPEALGARMPAPRWQRALARVPLGALGGCVVQQIPAGLSLRPAGATAPRTGELVYALAVHPERLTLLVGSRGASEEIIAEDLATLLAGLPAELRRSVRLAPGDGRDLLPVAETVADLLGTEIEVCTGLPFPLPDGAPGAAHAESVRLNSPEGEPTWPALLASVVCAPAGPDGHRPAARPARWNLPDPVDGPAPEPATLCLPDGAYAVAVRAGLWVGDSPVPPPEVRDRPAEARAARIEIADTADDTSRDRLLTSLAALLPRLDEQVREHAEIAAPKGAGPETVGALRRFSMRHGVAYVTGAREEGTSVTSDDAGYTPSEPSAAPPGAPVRPVALTSTSTGSPAPATAEATPVHVAAPASEPRPSGPEEVPAPVGASTKRSAAEAPAAVLTVPSVLAGRPATGSAARPAEEARIPAPSARASAVRSEVHATGSVPAPPAAVSTAALPAAKPVPAPPAAPRRTGTAPTGVSSDGDRAAFRELASDVWEEHTGPVNQALIRLPALRGAGEAAARADLIAVHLYLTSPPDGPFGAHALAENAEELRPYAACLSSGLGRLPALRGTLMRAVPGPDIPEDVVPGAFLHADAPLDAVHLEAPNAPVPPTEFVRYVIRPLTARRTSALTRDGSGAAALFAPGTAFSVLARYAAGDGLPGRVLLAEVPSGAVPFRPPSDEVVARLDTASRRLPLPAGPPWPVRCTGPFTS